MSEAFFERITDRHSELLLIPISRLVQVCLHEEFWKWMSGDLAASPRMSLQQAIISLYQLWTLHFMTTKLRTLHSYLPPAFSPCLFLFQWCPLFNNYSVTPGQMHFMFIFFCSSPSSLREAKALKLVCHLSFNEGNWCTFFPHLIKEQFNEILSAVSGERLMADQWASNTLTSSFNLLYVHCMLTCQHKA